MLFLGKNKWWWQQLLTGSDSQNTSAYWEKNVVQSAKIRGQRSALVDGPKISDWNTDILAAVIKSPTFSVVCDYTRKSWLMLVWPLLYGYTCTSVQYISLTQASRLCMAQKAHVPLLLLLKVIHQRTKKDPQQKRHEIGSTRAPHKTNINFTFNKEDYRIEKEL